MNSFADQLARTRAHFEGYVALPADLQEWVLINLEKQAPLILVRSRRDGHLRRAGYLIGGSVNHRAAEIERICATLERRWAENSRTDPDLSAPRGCVLAARLLGPLPKTRRLRSILACGSWQPTALRLPTDAEQDAFR